MKKTALLTIAYWLLLTTGAYAQVSRPQASNPPPQTPAVATQAADCGCEDKPLPEVLAIVNGTRITRADISTAAQTRIKDLQKQVSDARQAEVDLHINSLLLEAEAKKRGISTTKLLEEEVVAKVATPSEAEAQAFYDANKARIGDDFTNVRTEIIEYLTQQSQREMAKKLADRLRAAATLKISTDAVTAASTPAARARVFATVNGKNISSGDVEESLKPLIYSVQESVYTVRKQEVDLKINDMLLTEEAKKRSMTTSALLEAEVNSKAPTISEAEAQTFYDQNKERISGNFAATKSQIIQYLTDKAKRDAESAFADRLRNSAQVQVFLTAPAAPVYQIAIDDQPMRGNPNASVTVVEFTDFKCSSCAAAHPIIDRLVAEYGTRVRFVVRDFPLEQHDTAYKAAEAAEAAREQGKYWEYANLLYRNQEALQPEKLKEYASSLGLDRVRFDAALGSAKFADKVQRDMLDGQKLGVAGTPSIFVNGQRVQDLTYEGLKSALESRLGTR